MISFRFARVLYLAPFFPWVLHVAASQKLIWTSPLPGALYHPGDAIAAEWTSRGKLVSPSVSVCTVKGTSAVGTKDHCGGSKWPEVKQSGDRYFFSLAVPSTTFGTSRVYLRVEDTSGNVFKSPGFILSPDSGPTPYKPSGSNRLPPPDDADEHKVSGGRVKSSPVSSDNGSSSSSDSGNKKPIIPSRSTNSTTMVSEAASTASFPATRTARAPLSTTSEPSEPSSSSTAMTVVPRSAIASRAALPTAVFAVPLSLVVATFLVSAALYLAHRRSLAAQHARNARFNPRRSASVRSIGGKIPFISSAASKSSCAAELDVEKAMGVPYEGDCNPPPSHAGAQRQGSAVHAPDVPRYPVPRQDVRREQTGQTYVSPYLEYSSRPPLSCSRPSAKEYARSLHTYHGRVYHGNDDVGNDGALEKSTISPGNSSTQPPASRLSRSGLYCESPRAPPRLHSRRTAPELDARHDSRRDEYAVARRAVSRTRSYSSL